MGVLDYLLIVLIAGTRIYVFLRIFVILKSIANENFLLINITIGFLVFYLPYLFSASFLNQWQSATMGDLILFALTEIAIGALLAVLISLPIMVIESLGQLIDNQRNFVIEGSTNVVDRSYSSQTQNILTAMSVLVFFHFDFHLWMVELLFQSFRFYQTASLLNGIESVIENMYQSLDLYGLVIWILLPIIIFFIWVDLVIGYVAKRIPTLNVYEVAGALKSIIFSFMLAIILFLLLGNGGQDVPLRNMIGPLPTLEDIF